MARLLYCLIAFCSIMGCMDSSKVAPSIALLGATQDLPRLEYGRELYLEYCTKCHNAPRITRYPLNEWREIILPDMLQQSKLSGKETDAVTAYVIAVLTQ